MAQRLTALRVMSDEFFQNSFFEPSSERKKCGENKEGKCLTAKENTQNCYA
jgi:hypothetical protein